MKPVFPDTKNVQKSEQNMIAEYGDPRDIDPWMELVTQVRWNFPGLETQEALDEHRATVLRFMGKKQAVCVKNEGKIAGVILFSRGHNMICFLAVSPGFRRRGVATLLMDEALSNLDRTREIAVSTFTADDEKGPAPRTLYKKYGFIEDELIEEFNYPNQLFILHPEGSERKNRQLAINRMVREISSILADNRPVIYLYGSSVLNDFRPGWSDIDILVLTQEQITKQQAVHLVTLRQTLLKDEPDDPYYRSFEGGMLTLDAFLTGKPDRVVYWGTSGERITDTYAFDSFCMTELITDGALLYGKDIRKQLKLPCYVDLYSDVNKHYETITRYASCTGRSFYSFGWMLDISRCIYTLRTGKVISKTGAAEWALENDLCPERAALETALTVRKAPLKYKHDEYMLDQAEKISGAVLRYAEVLKHELETTNASSQPGHSPYS
ncbi:MAG: hypothetical protein CW338_06340 [Clostridiales bacterium]|nr:hypothetical protein [Clostridiales bacterium]